MKKLKILFLFMVINSSVSVYAGLLGEVFWIGDHGRYGLHDNFTFGICTREMTKPLFASDVGSTINFTPESKGFDKLASILTNGTNDIIMFTIGSGGVGRYEERIVNKFIDSPWVDFYGYEISEVILTINDYTLNSPGHNPNGDGNWTDIHLDLTFSVYGEPVPEPCSIFLLSMGGLFLYRRNAE